MDSKTVIKFAILGIFSLFIIYGLLTPLIYAAFIAYLIYPVFKKINEFLKNKNLSAGITTGLILVLIVYPTYKIAQRFVSRASGIANQVVQGFTKFASFLGLNVSNFASLVPDSLIQKVILNFGGILLNLPIVILEIFVFAILTFYFLRDGENIKNYIQDLADKQSYFDNILEDFQLLMRSIFVGTLTSAIIIGIVAGLFLKMLGVPFYLTVAAITAVSALLPAIGTWIAYVPLVGYYLLIAKNYPMAGIMIVFAFLLQFLEIYLGPFLSGKKAKVHPALLLLGFIGGPLVLGLKGLIIGPVILGILKIALDNYREQD